MTSTRGISRVVVASDTNVGMSTMITRVTVSHSLCFLTLTYFLIRPYLLKPKVSYIRHWKFFFTAASSLASPFSCISRLLLTEVSHIISLEQSLGCLPDRMTSHKTDVLNFVQWKRVQIMVLLWGLEWQRPPLTLSYGSRILLAKNKVINLKTTPYSRYLKAWIFVPPTVALKSRSYAPVSI